MWGGTPEWFVGAGKAGDEAQAAQCHVLTQQIFRDRIQHTALYFPPAPSSALLSPPHGASCMAGRKKAFCGGKGLA